MPNDRFSEIEARWEKHKESRDQELGELREALAAALAQQASAQRTSEDLARKLTEIERSKPTTLAIISPAAAVAVVVGSLGVFVLSQALKPIESDLRSIHRFEDDVKGVNSVIAERQWQMFGKQEYQRGWSECQRQN